MEKPGRRFQQFVARFQALATSTEDEARLLREGGVLLRELVSHDDWLPEAYARAPEKGYAQYLLHLDPRKRFSVVSFAWSPGVVTPIHDHTVWGLVGVMRGAELCHEYDWPKEGQPMKAKMTHRLDPGAIDTVSPTVGDVHVVENAYKDKASLSVHVYGGDIGRTERHVFDAQTGAARRFVSGYSNVQG
ncbi:MAG TPA: cysteine dioxygenase [Burkholderiales bacterium]|nr:cysteine dioxygenase [Burkholderiales bacterium]